MFTYIEESYNAQVRTKCLTTKTENQFDGEERQQLNEMTITLQKQYEKELRLLCPFAWLTNIVYGFDDVFISLKARYIFGQKHEEIENTVLDITELLHHSIQTHQGEDFSRSLLIEGDPGSGKSTFCNRIAYQWCQERNDIKELTRFHLVLTIKISLIQRSDTDIYDYIAREMLPDFDKGTIRKILKKLGNKVLFLFDGYDEMSGNRKVVDHIIARKVCSLSSVIVTSRFSQIPRHRFDNSYSLESLGLDEVKKFILNMQRKNGSNLSITSIDVTNSALSPLLANPLFMWFFVFLDKHIFDNMDLTSRTKLYRAVMDGLIQNTVDRLGISKDDCLTALKELQAIAYDCIKNDKLHFSLNQNEDKLLLKLGFIRQSMSNQGFASSIVCTFNHKSILEFLTAKHIVDSGEADIIQKLRDLPEVSDLRRRRSSFIIIFVCGLIQKETDVIAIFDQFVPEFNVDESQRGEARFYIEQVKASMTLLHPVYQENKKQNMLTFFSNLTTKIDTWENDLDQMTSVELSHLHRVHSVLHHAIKNEQLTPIETEEQNRYDNNDHEINHLGLQCLAELQNISNVGNMWRHRVGNIIKLYANRCTQYCSLGLECLCTMDINPSYELKRLDLDFETKDGFNMLGDNKVIRVILNAAKQNKLMIRNDQTQAIWQAMNLYYQKVSVNNLLIYRCENLPHFDRPLNVKRLELHYCTDKFSGYFISMTCDRLEFLKINAYKMNWCKENIEDLKAFLIRNSALHGTSDCPIQEISAWLIPGNFLNLLTRISLNNVLKMEIYEVTSDNDEMNELVDLILASKIYKLKICKLSVIEESGKLKRDEGQCVLLRRLVDAPYFLNVLKHLEIICVTKGCLENLIWVLLNSTQSQLKVFRYGRSTVSHEGTITNEDEQLMWEVLATNCYDFEEIGLFDDNYDNVDTELSKEVFLSVIQSLSRDKTLLIKWKRVIQINYRIDSWFSHLTEIENLIK